MTRPSPCFDPQLETRDTRAMLKIMLVLDNSADEEFLGEVLKRLSYIVISIKKSGNFSEQLIDHFPDLVFASTLGTNEKILSALAKIKQARGKPKLVFVRQQKEAAPLNEEQKRVIDGVLYTPIDPLKLIEILGAVTDEDVADIWRRYREMTKSGKKGSSEVGGEYAPNEEISNQPSQVTAKSNSEVITGRVTQPVQKTDAATSSEPGVNNVKSSKLNPAGSGFGDVLLFDSKRKSRYDDICAKMEPIDRKKQNLDVKEMKRLQENQLSELSKEDLKAKKERKHFVMTLFSTDPSEIKKDES